MTSPTRTLVTGSTGVLGRAIVNAAVAAGLPLRLGARTPAKARPDVDAVPFDYAVPATIAPALAGVSAVVLMAPPLDPNAPAYLSPVIEAAKVANVQHIVLISAFGVNHSEGAPLRVVEHLVINSGVPYTIARPNFFMENFSEGFLSTGIREHAAIHLAAGDGKTSFISVNDVAAVVVEVLRRQLVGRELDLTGPEALDHSDAAAIISGVVGRDVAYHALSEEQMLSGARSHGMPEPMVVYMGMLYAVVRQGLASGTTSDYEQTIGRAPTSFREFAREAQSSWR